MIGPIASGKSSVAIPLANHLGNKEGSVMVLGDIVAITHAPAYDAKRSWRRAQWVHGRFVGEWFMTGVDVAIIDGPFCTESETSTMVQHVPTDDRVKRVLHHATF